MQSPAIIDIFAAAVLVGFTIYGARRGLFRALAGLLAVIVALIGAGIIASALAAPAAEVVTPLIRERIEGKVDNAVTDQMPQVQMPEADVEEPGISVDDILTLLGFDNDVRDSLAEQAREQVRDTGVSVVMAVVESMAESMIHAALYILSFLALLLVLKLVTRLLDAVLSLPGLHLLNMLGGGVIGLVEGALLLFLAVWVLRRFGISFDTETVAETHVLRFFTTNTPLSALSFLK